MRTAGKTRHHVRMAARGEPLQSKKVEEVATILDPLPATTVDSVTDRTGATTHVRRLLPSGNEAGTPPKDRAFRPDIQGLRAVAVLLVVIVHAQLRFLYGGFFGVDVFFVISGFVITGSSR